MNKVEDVAMLLAKRVNNIEEDATTPEVVEGDGVEGAVMEDATRLCNRLNKAVTVSCTGIL